MKKLPVLSGLYIAIFLWMSLFPEIVCSQINPVKQLKFSPLSSFEALPSEEVTRILEDSRGFLWVATNAGLCRYDGYRLYTYKDNLYMPGLLSNNKIKSLAEDKEHNLWIGTEFGINKMDLITGDISYYTEGVLSNPIFTLCATSNNQLWAGMDGGVLRYEPSTDNFVIYTVANNDNALVGIKSIFEDSKGRLWFGTWAYGLFRYDPEEDIMISYPPINARNSVHVIFEDSDHTIWIGSWDEGLYKMSGLDSPETTTWEEFKYHENNKRSISDNVIYCISEDVNNKRLWIGTRNGLSVLDLNAVSAGFVNYLPENGEAPLPYNELNTIIQDRNGIMWLGMLGGGVYSVNMSNSPFESYTLESVRQTIFSNSVRNLFVDSDQTLWIGVGSHGLAIQEKGMKEPVFYTDYPGFGKDLMLHTVNCMFEKKGTKEIWFSIPGHGIFVYDKRASGEKLRRVNPFTTTWLPEWSVLSMMEDSSGNIWLGGRSDIFIRQSEQTVQVISLNLNCNALIEAADGSIWIGTNQGIARFQGPLSDIDESGLEWYTSANGKLSFDNIGFLFQDSRENIWVGSEGGGLTLYDKESDTFVAVNERYNILVDGIYAMEEDNGGNLWIATGSNGLLRLEISEDLRSASSRTYTVSDGLQDNYFTKKASCKAPDGKLYFGSHKGYNAFYPEQINENELASDVVITDITVFNQSLRDMDEDEVHEITDKTPDFAEKIVLDYKRNHFSIEFSVLSYANPSRNNFAYWLEGYDSDWQYTGASNRMANYNNLKSGTYYFHLRGANENGVWSTNEKTLQIVILPPPWRTAWAYTLYFCFLLLLIVISYKMLRNRIRQKQAYQMSLLEQAKAEEINHAKLQFFTNITHELLTPLTILSASLEELRVTAPRNKSSYKIMSENLNRLFRLLQQILEFRKAETGNLKLKVSEGNITAFIRKEIDAFTPLLKKKKMRFIWHAEPDTIMGYFDPDKLDKILYNLLSNAAKYNRNEGEITVTVSYGHSEEELVFSVKDDGQGIKPEAMKSLFKRFYEGDYRRFNTIGTGIGLSLTRDLVTLHKGTIEVESEEGKGACFIVRIPIGKSAFSPEEIDEVVIEETKEIIDYEEIAEYPVKTDEEKSHAILLVEDNSSLLNLMYKLLNRDYRVYTSKNGKVALEVIKKEEVDLIVSDIMMPEMDGIEFCKTIKGNLEYSHIPVLLLTAKNQEEDRIEAYESGADGFITKPFNLSLLHARIQNLLKKRERTASDFKKQIEIEVQDMEYTSLDEEFLQKAIECVHRHLKDQNFDQVQFMEEMNTSKSTLYKKLKSLTGLNTSGFIRNVRLKAACKIIEEKGRNLRVSELAYAVGFNDPKYFSASFKKEFGMLPSEYIERYYPEEEEV